MRLMLEEIKTITVGAVEIDQIEDVFHFHRFSEEQRRVCREDGTEDLYVRTFGNAGIRFAFRTDAMWLSFDYEMKLGSSREYSSFDVYEDGVLMQHLETDEKGHLEIALSFGEKLVEVYFPWTKGANLSNIEVGECTKFEAVKRTKNMLCYGDSITQGYDAIYPSLSYANQLAELFDADCYNKALGGATFFPEFLQVEEKAPYPDIITVAYGTNDWNLTTKEEFQINCRTFIEILRERYSDVPIYVITPLWRTDVDAETKFGAHHSEVGKLILDICKEFSNTHVIQGYEMVPHMAEFYADRFVHPNDLGFGIFAKNLAKKMVQRERIK